ncbi:MAG: ribbon-helix-helix protein, CopG family [Hyphomicrobiales bacterium]|nr:ribbon-helix-helix protein, CopG family [Hyphomicrobiales bacterium]MBV8439750.1 ribbon-helix-helix protein, CopG family [Hyphomicrobiales bacterium]
MAERTTVRLPEDLVRRAKRKAAAEGRSLTALIEDGLRRVVDETSGLRQAERVLPPVSSATGGLMPGIDLDDSAALQELDDLSYVRRMR